MEQVGALTTVRFPEPAASLRDHQGLEPLQFIYYDSPTRVEWIPPLLSMFLEAKVTRGPKRIQISRRILLLNADLQLSEISQGLLSPRCIDGPWSVAQGERVRLIPAGFKNRADERKPDKDTRLYNMMRVRGKSSACLSVMRSQNGFKGWSHFRFKHSETSSTVYLHDVSVDSV